MSSIIEPRLSGDPAQARQSARSLGLPRDLDDLVIEEIARGINAPNDPERRLEVRANLRNCSLVCRSWLHSSRKHISFIVRETTVLGFIQHCLTSPSKILPTTIRRLVWRGMNPGPIVPFLHELPQLRALAFWISVPPNIPILPTVVELTLHRVEFTNWTTLSEFLGKFPALQHFREFNLRIGQTPLNSATNPLPVLQTLHLSSEPYLTRELAAVSHPLIARELQLDLPNKFGSSRVQLMSQYLRKLGAHLEHLHISVPRRFKFVDPDSLPPLDVQSNTSLSRLTMEHFIQCSFPSPNEIHLGINPTLAHFLSQLVSQGPIDLALEVLTVDAGAPNLPFREFAIASRDLRMRSLTFYIGDRFRVAGVEHWPVGLKERLQSEFVGVGTGTVSFELRV